MIRREKLHALIVARRNVGEADRLITCFTKEHGLLEVRASGVRKIPSRRGGHVEPFTHVLGIISGVPGRLYVAGVETLDSYDHLKADEEAFEQAQLLTSYVMHLLPEAEPQPALFDALYHAWHILPELVPVKRGLLEVAITMCVLQAVGLMPNLQSCEECGIAKPTEAVVLDSKIGCFGAAAGISGSADFFFLPHRAIGVVRRITIK